MSCCCFGFKVYYKLKVVKNEREMPFDLGMEVSNITNKQQYGEEWCFRESEKAKVLNKALGNIQKIKKEKSCLR